jgi:mannan endo-1,6-alpha-mannosidase
MYNYTNGSDIWATRLNGFINKTNTFFQPKYKSVMLDLCEIPQKCNVSKAYVRTACKTLLTSYLNI